MHQFKKSENKNKFIVEEKNETLKKFKYMIVVYILNNYIVSLIFVKKDKNEDFYKKLKVAYKCFMLAFCLTMLYLNGIIIHPTNVAHALWYVAMGEILFVPMVKDTLFYSNYPKLGYLLVEFVRYVVSMYAFVLMIHFVRL